MATEIIKAVCPHDCPDTCAMLVTVEDGRAVRMAGDPDHSFTQGFLCTKVAKYIERTYHDGRLAYPQIRIGAKGEGKFRRASWDDALSLIAARLQSIIDSPDGPQAILPYSYAGTLGIVQSEAMASRSASESRSRKHPSPCSTSGPRRKRSSAARRRRSCRWYRSTIA